MLWLWLSALLSCLRSKALPRTFPFLHCLGCGGAAPHQAENRKGCISRNSKDSPAALAVSKRVNSSKAPGDDSTLVEAIDAT